MKVNQTLDFRLTMQYRLMREKVFLLVLFFCVSVGISQSYFNRITGSNPYLGSARSFGMGNTVHSDRSTRLLLLNPAGLWRLPADFSFEYHLSGNSILERRGFDLKDFFGDYLTTSDYVVNQTNRFFQGIGISGSKTMGLYRLTAAISSDPLTSFAYKYEEEIRGSLSFDDGIIGNKDPLLGFHYYEVHGQLDKISIGLGIRYLMDEKFTMNWGLAYHKVSESSIHDVFQVDTLRNMDGYLATINPISEIVFTPKGGFLSYSIELNTWKNIHFSFSIDTELKIESDSYNPPLLDVTSGLPGFFSGDTLSYHLAGISYVKPARKSFGISYTTYGRTPVYVVADFTTTDGYSIALKNDEIFQINETNSWHLGIEYMATNKIPVRVGMVYNQSPFQVMDPQTTITVGTGKSFDELQVDVGLGFQSGQYKYPDLFPVENDVRPSLDRVTESKFNFMLSISYTI